MVMDQERDLLHITSYPKCHYFLYDLKTRTLEDLGRFGNVHQLALFLDEEGNGYTTDSFGRMLRCDVQTRRLRRLNTQLPHAPFRRGEHNIMFHAAKEPGSGLIYGTGYAVDARLFRYDPKRDEMTDLGLAYGREDVPLALQVPYPGGLTFGKDGHLYYAIAARKRAPGSGRDGHLIRRNVTTGSEEDLGIVAADGLTFSGRSCHGKTDSLGNIYLAQNGAVPPQFFVYRRAGLPTKDPR